MLMKPAPRFSVFKLIKAISARFLFVIHAFVAVWRVYAVYKDPAYWCLIGISLLTISEGFMNIYFRGGDETVGFCPSVFLYLCSVVPAIWLLELNLANKRRNGLVVEELNATITTDELSQLLREVNLFPTGLNESLWAQVVEQLLLVVLVVGRWLLPKGELSRDELSQLLLVYVGTAADIAELFEAFKEPQVSKNMYVTYLILGLWSWSLLQFTIVLASNHKSRRRTPIKKEESVSHLEDGFHLLIRGKHPVETDEVVPLWKWFCTNLDVFGIMLSTCLQDGPFLCIRLFLLIRHNVVSYMMIFFTCKNTLVLLLQWYRLSVIVAEKLRQTKRHNMLVNTKPPEPLENGTLKATEDSMNTSQQDATSSSSRHSLVQLDSHSEERETWIWL